MKIGMNDEVLTEAQAAQVQETKPQTEESAASENSTGAGAKESATAVHFKDINIFMEKM